MQTLSDFMQPFFEWLLRSTSQAGVVICLILVIQTVLRNRLTARWHYALWLILVVRMVLPWAPQSRLSIYNLAGRQNRSDSPSLVTSQGYSETPEALGESPAAKQALAEPKPVETTEVQDNIQPAAAIRPRESERSAMRTVFELSYLLPLLWLGGALLLGGYIVFCNLRLWRAASVECPSTDRDTLELLEECRTAIGLRTIVALIPSAAVNTPILLGFVRPRLLVPKYITRKLTREELRYIFLHELAHVKRHDIALGWLTALLQVLHWFNPLVWFAFHRMRSGRESACDALVLSRMQGQGMQNYGLAIVSLLEHFSVPQPLPGLAGILESKSQLKRRIAMITQFRHDSYRFSPLAVVLILILACISLPDATRTKASETMVSEAAYRLNFRKIQIPYDASRLRDAQLSPDGKSIAFVLDHKLWIMPRVGKLGPDIPGSPRLLDTGDIELAWQGLAWSGDGRWIAFHGRDELNEKEKRWGNRGVYVISVDGGKPKQVYEKWRYGDWIVNYQMSLSPNGKTLTFSCVDANEQHIYTIGVDGGVPRRLLEAPAREPVFSPDGKMIAYVADKDMGAKGGGLWVVSADGGTPGLIADAGNATSPVWSPDGRMIAFLDQKMSKQIFIVPIGKEGKAAGEKITIDCPEGVDLVRRLTGWTPDDKLGTVFACQGQYGLYTLPATGGMVTLAAFGGELLSQPRWSGDGRRIIVTVAAGEGRDGWKWNGLASISAEGGEISMIPIRADSPVIKLTYGGGNHVSPDGKTIVFAGRKKDQKEWWFNHIWTLPFGGGQPKQLTDTPAPLTDWYPCWSPDGKAIAFIRSKTDPAEFNSIETDIFIVPANGGEPRRLTRESDKVLFGYIAWSPDGKWLSYFSAGKESPGFEVVLKVVPSEGGPSRVVGKLEQKGFDIRMESAWSADSKRIAFIGTDYKVIRIMSMDDGSITEIDPHLSDTNIWHLDWSRNGDRLAFSGRQGGGLGFWMIEKFLPAAAVAQDPWSTQATTLRKILPEEGDFANVSPDGKYLCDADSDTGNLAIRELATGKRWPVTGKKTWEESEEWAEDAAISPDSRRVAYIWYREASDIPSLYVVNLDGSDRKLLCKDIYAMPRDWSADGSRILTVTYRPPHRMFWVSASDGSILPIKDIEKGFPGKFDVSPDGRFIAYDLPQAEGSLKRDVFLLDLSDNSEIRLAEHPANDRLLGWTTDGKWILFASDRSDKWDAWLLSIKDGVPTGPPRMVKANIGDVGAAGFAANGDYYYNIYDLRSNVYVAQFDPVKGAMLSPPALMQPNGKSGDHVWSPDGRHLAYACYTDDETSLIKIWSLASGQERELDPKLPRRLFSWAPDGKSLLLSGLINEGWYNAVYRLDLETGECSELLRHKNMSIAYAQWLPDGKRLLYNGHHHGSNPPRKKLGYLMIRDMDSGAEREITSGEFWKDYQWAMSPDGRKLAVKLKGDNACIKIFSTETDEAREILSGDLADNALQITWTPDGRALMLHVRPAKLTSEIWRIAVDGGKFEKLSDIDIPESVTDMRIDPTGRHIALRAHTNLHELWVMENFLPADVGK